MSSTGQAASITLGSTDFFATTEILVTGTLDVGGLISQTTMDGNSQFVGLSLDGGHVEAAGIDTAISGHGTVDAPFSGFADANGGTLELGGLTSSGMMEIASGSVLRLDAGADVASSILECSATSASVSSAPSTRFKAPDMISHPLRFHNLRRRNDSLATHDVGITYRTIEYQANSTTTRTSGDIASL